MPETQTERILARARERLEAGKSPTRQQRQHANREFWAGFWGVAPRQINRWEARGIPYQDPRPFREWLESNRDGVSPAVREKLERMTGALTVAPTTATEPPPDAAEEFDDRLIRWRDACAASYDRALAEGRLSDVEFFEERVVKLDKTLRENKLLAKKLGIEEGSLIAKEEFERVVRAIILHLVAGISSLVSLRATRFIGLPDRAAAADRLERELTRAVLFAPLLSAVRQPSGVGLPEWVGEAFRDGVDLVVESGAALWDRVK